MPSWARAAAAQRTTVEGRLVEQVDQLAADATGITPEQQKAIGWMLDYGKRRTGRIALPLPGHEVIYAERLDRWS